MNPVSALDVRRETWAYCADENCMECAVAKKRGLPATLPAPRIPWSLRLRRVLGGGAR